MPLLRKKIASEIETGCIEDHNFLCLLSQDENSSKIANQARDPCGKPVTRKAMDRSDSEKQVVNLKSANQIQCTSKSTDMLLGKKKAPSGDKECGKIVIDPPVDNEVCEWDMLNPALQSFLPPDNSFNYVITEFISLSTESFPGSPEYAYKATVRINAVSEDSAKTWMQKMMIHSRCTYRHRKVRFEESSL